MNNAQPVIVEPFPHPDSNTISYIVKDPATRACAIIDPVLDFDYAAGRTATQTAARMIDFINSHALRVEWIIETHAHADHLSAAPYLKQVLGGKIAIGHNIVEVQRLFAEIFSEADTLPQDGSQFDHLFHDGETYRLGETSCTAIATPGHTPACMSHIIGDAIFVGDTLFMPDSGTARVDFPGGSAQALYRSTERILSYAADTRLFICHDYGPGGRQLLWQTTVGEQRQHNIHVGDRVDRESFIKLRTERDATLPMPRLLIPAIQVNIRAGHFPDKDPEGKCFLKVPVDLL